MENVKVPNTSTVLSMMRASVALIIVVPFAGEADGEKVGEVVSSRPTAPPSKSTTGRPKVRLTLGSSDGRLLCTAVGVASAVGEGTGVRPKEGDGFSVEVGAGVGEIFGLSELGNIALEVGSVVGVNVGRGVGLAVCLGVNRNVGFGVGRVVGFDAGSGVGGFVGFEVGSGVGRGVGFDVGSGVERGVGFDVGSGVERGVGLDVGLGVGRGVGLDVGLGVGRGVGLDVGRRAGLDVGLDVGT